MIISNHNYARWLGEAVDSALAQDDVVEVIVVDDGSTDDSRELIATYNGGVRAILQDNGGQAAALNAGFAASKGDPVLFLDADDVLLDGALREAAAVLEDDSVALVHWTHEMIDERSRPLGARHPAGELPSGDLRPMISELGPGTHRISPTSGNVLPRWLLDQLMPMPAEFRICADVYLTHLAPLFGRVVALDRPYSLYRVHPQSGYSAASFDRRLELGYEKIEQVIEPCAEFCGRLGLPADPEGWRRNSWFHRLHAAVATLDRWSSGRAVPPDRRWADGDDRDPGSQHDPVPGAQRSLVGGAGRRRRGSRGAHAPTHERRRLSRRPLDRRLVARALQRVREPPAGELPAGARGRAADRIRPADAAMSTASVIVTNHNYARWLGEAIDSALAQADAEVEVIVVDDGSTDHSRDVIASYDGHVRAVFQANGGQAAAINAGFAASSGDPVLFLDADDVLLPQAVARARAALEDGATAQVHWPHVVIDEDSRSTGERFPDRALPSGDLTDVVVRQGPGVMLTTPTSGNVFPAGCSSG